MVKRRNESRLNETVCMRRVKYSPLVRGEYIGWRYLARNRGAPHFVMTSLSCRRVDNAPHHCRFLRTFDFAGDCRVNFSGVCCIVAREYEGRCFAAIRESALVIIPSRSPLRLISLPLSSRGSPGGCE